MTAPWSATRPAASAEYGGEFRRDIEGFVSIKFVTACVSRGVYERAPLRGVIYSAFVDQSGGSGDAMTLAVGHQDHARQAAVVDALREVTPPFSPEQVVEQFSSLLRSYNCDKVVGDRYAGEWPVPTHLHQLAAALVRDDHGVRWAELQAALGTTTGWARPPFGVTPRLR